MHQSLSVGDNEHLSKVITSLSDNHPTAIKLDQCWSFISEFSDCVSVPLFIMDDENLSYPQLSKNISSMKNTFALQEALHVLNFELLSQLVTIMSLLKPAYEQELKK